MFHVEFMGIPGCGKSTLLNRLVIALNRSEYKYFIAEEALLLAVCLSKKGRLFEPIIKLFPLKLMRKKAHAIFNIAGIQETAQCRFIAQRPDALQTILDSELFFNISLPDRALAISRFLETASMYQLIHEKMNVNFPVIFDEGFLQRTMSLFMAPGFGTSHFSDRHLYAYLNNIPQPTLVIWIDANTETCYKRMIARRKGLPVRLFGVDKDMTINFLNDCRSHFEKIGKWMIESDKNIIQIPNENGLNAALEMLAAKVTNYTNNT